jgi:serine/threonine protein kinase
MTRAPCLSKECCCVHCQEGSLDVYISKALQDPVREVELALPSVVGWMIDTMRGLWHLHHSGVAATLHRDLKPPNFLVVCREFGPGPGPGPVAGAGAGARTYAERPVHIKLGDFDSARVGTCGLDASAGGNLYTQAPEVNMHGSTPASDVFAWAVSMCWVGVQVRNLLYCLHSGKCLPTHAAVSAIVSSCQFFRRWYTSAAVDSWFANGAASLASVGW